MKHEGINNKGNKETKNKANQMKEREKEKKREQRKERQIMAPQTIKFWIPSLLRVINRQFGVVNFKEALQTEIRWSLK